MRKPESGRGRACVLFVGGPVLMGADSLTGGDMEQGEAGTAPAARPRPALPPPPSRRPEPGPGRGGVSPWGTGEREALARLEFSVGHGGRLRPLEVVSVWMRRLSSEDRPCELFGVGLVLPLLPGPVTLSLNPRSLGFHIWNVGVEIPVSQALLRNERGSRGR